MWTDFVDVVFVVNLEQRKDRMNETAKQLDRHRIKFWRWAAVKDDDGERGLRETMHQLLTHSVQSGYKRICVFEDDINILRENFNDLLAAACDQVPKDFHMLYMGGNIFKQPFRKSANIVKVPIIYSTHAIIYSAEAIQYILQKFDVNQPYDRMLVNDIQRINKVYCAFPLLVSQRTGYSDIAKKEKDYRGVIESRFAKKTKNI